VVAVALAAVLAALWFFTARDDATTSAPPAAAAPGRPFGGPYPDAAAVRRGNVVLLAAPGQLRGAQALAGDLAGPASPALRDAGQAVLVQPGPAPGVDAYAAGRTLRAARADAPALREFIEYWLGRSAG
jgi:hypothetical protein